MPQTQRPLEEQHSSELPRDRAARDGDRVAVAATLPAGKFIAFAAFAVVLLWVAYLARWGILVVYLSALIATGISPLAGWIQRRRVPGIRICPPRWLAALVVYLAGLGLLVAVGWAIVPPLIAQAQALARNWPSLFDNAERFLVHHGLIAHQMSMRELVQQLPAELGSAVLRQFWSVIGGVFGLLLILVLSLYLLHDAQRLHDVLLSFLPPARRRQVGRLSREIMRRIGAWMTGQLLLSGIIGATTALALGLIGVPYFYVLAVVSAAGEPSPTPDRSSPRSPASFSH